VRDLQPAEMDALLATVPHGRLGTLRDGEPYVVPVGFVWVDGRVWFHSAEGTKTRCLLHRPQCTFQVDTYDSDTADWSSVMMWGVARPGDQLPHALPAAWQALRERFGHVLHRVVSGTGSGRLWAIEVQRRTGRTGP